MNENRQNKLGLEPNPNLVQPLDVSDNLAPLTTDNSPAVAALQEEVIRLRKEGQPDSLRFLKKGETRLPETSDSLTGEVRDYTPLIAAFTPSPKLFKTDTGETQIQPLAAPSSTTETDTQLAATFAPDKRSIPLALQDNLITPAAKPEAPPKEVAKLLPLSPPTMDNTSLASVEFTNATAGTERTRQFDTSATQNQSLESSPAEVIAINNQAQRPLETLPASVARADVAVPNAPYQSTFLANSTAEPTITRTFNTGKLATDAPAIAQNSAIPSTPSTSPLPMQESAGKHPTLGNAVDRSIAVNQAASIPNSANSSTERNPARSVSDTQIASTEKTQKPEQIAFSPSQPNQAHSAVISEAGKSSVNQETTSSQKQNQFLPPQQGSERSSIIAASNASDYGAFTRDLPKDGSKENKDKDFQLANALNYPKYGGTSASDESTKPVIPQQRPQTFQSSLARDSAPEKAHPLSESFVSGKILPQTQKDGQPDNKTGNPKSGEANVSDSKSNVKSADSKTVDTRGESRSPDVRFVEGRGFDSRLPDGRAEGRIPEGRTADQRSLDSSHIPSQIQGFAAGRTGADAQFNPQGLPLAGERIVPGAISPGQAGRQPVEGQPAGRSESGQKADATSADGTTADKTGKKNDSVDDKKDGPTTGKAPGTPADTSKIPGNKAFNDLLDFIDKADQPDIKGGGKATPLTGSNILFPDDVLVTGTGAIGQAGIAGVMGNGEKDELSDEDKLSQRRKKYIVQPGDTIDSIATKELGDARYANLILTINQANIASRMEDGKRIAIRLQPGQVLWLPSDHELQVHAEIYLLDAH